MKETADTSQSAHATARLRWLAASIVGVALLGFVLWHFLRPARHGVPAVDGPRAQGPVAASSGFVGSAACAGCHADEYARWRGSQHAVAMQDAGEGTVLGDFDDATFTRQGVTTTFFRRDGRFFVRTDGADGKLADFEVRYTFGVYPLQQYLIELPRGRKQALTIAWDSRPAAQGGQRWFDLYPGQKIEPGDELHWTGRQQNWNYMCADCHSTDLRKNYDAATDTYATRWSEISVGCEACHGPGAEHVALAGQAARAGRPLERSGLAIELDERRGIAWSIDPRTGNGVRSAPRTTDREIGVCAQCHARREQLSNDYHAGEPFADHYLPSVLTSPLYYPDGQQRDEVYNWGSFLSSRMYSKGVTCSDCHEPHGGQLRAPGNLVCGQCHLASKYDAASHHFHPPGSAGATCTACHMKTETYMVVDPRLDHSIRIPRPDLTTKLGLPNACNQCHADRSARWAEREIRRHYPQPNPGFQDFAETFAASDAGRPVTIELTQLVANQEESAIARASALARLARWPGENSELAAEAALQDASDLVRRAAIDAYAARPPNERLTLVPLLSDPVRSVRTLAARALAPVPAASLDPAARAAYDKAVAEYVASEQFNADRPEHRTNLGGFLADRGEYPASEAAYRSALQLDPKFVPAWVNLADLMRVQGRNADATRALRDGLAISPSDPALHHSLGLALVREHQLADALAELQRATVLAPGNARYAYVYGVALFSSGRPSEGITVLQQALSRAPGDRDLLSALALYSAQAGDTAAARGYAERLLQLDPGDRDARALLDRLGPGPLR